jgi:hypothetical protein
VSDASGDGYAIEQTVDGHTLIVTDKWTSAASAAVERPDVDAVWLNYARGYSEPDLSFVEAWPIKRLLVLDRSVTDLTPLARLGQTLEDLSLQVAPGVSIDLATLPQLHSLAAYWDVIEDTLYAPEHLGELVIMEYDELDLDPLTVQRSLQSIKLKVASNLSSLDGAGGFPTLTSLQIAAARNLHDLGALEAASATLRELAFESCREIYEIQVLGALSELRFLEIADCGMIPTIRPLGDLAQLEILYAWGTTRIDDCDLSPLLRLASLKEIRMRDRREYRPSLTAVKEQLGCA